MIIFLDILDNWLGESRRWSVESIPDFTNAQGRQLSLLLTKGYAWNRLRFLKKHFTFLEELNRRIRENGTNLRLPCTYLLQVSPLPDHAQWSLPQNIAYFAFFPDFSHLFSDSDHFFGDPWVPLTFSPAATLIVYHILIKIRKKNQCFDSTLSKRAYKAFEWEAKFVWALRGVSSDEDYF